MRKSGKTLSESQKILLSFRNLPDASELVFTLFSDSNDLASAKKSLPKSFYI